MIEHPCYAPGEPGVHINTVRAFYCLGLGMLNPAAQALMSRAVPATHQGLLQGAMTSVMTLCAIVGPLTANGLFAVFVNPELPFTLPGAPFFLGAALSVVTFILAVRKPTAAVLEVAPALQLNYSAPPE